MAARGSFTGQSRTMKTRWTVRAADVVSRLLITVGGLGTIIAVSTVFLFLLWVVMPLMTGARTSEAIAHQIDVGEAKPLHVAVDEYRLLGWALFSDGRLVCYEAEKGAVVEERHLFADREITAFSMALDNRDCVFGFADGTVNFANIGFETTFIDDHDAPAALHALEIGERIRDGKRMVQRISDSQFRARELTVEIKDTIEPETNAAVHLIAQATTPSAKVYATLTEDRALRIYRLSERKNILTGKVTCKRKVAELPYEGHEGFGLPRYMIVSGLGDYLMTAWQDGYGVRYNTRDFKNPHIEERLRLVEGEKAQITVLRYLLGGTTIMVGDSLGRVRAWFPVHAPYAENKARTRLVAAHEFAGTDSPVTCLASSTRMRMFMAGHRNGSITLYHVTSHKRLGDLRLPGNVDAVEAAAFAPKDDGLVALGKGAVATWDLDPRYPEVTLQSLFLPVWYEGESEPVHVWQSSSATDDFEPKFGLMPLIFGTIKATIFSLCFGLPIALLAAVFTSEFLNPKTRARIKPLVEMMASLPSVVLGFLAALVFAPIVGEILPVFLAVFVTVPMAFLIGAYLWQLLPHKFSLRIQHWRFPAMFLPLPLGFGLALALGPIIENVCFSGDIVRWLDGQIGSAHGGWLALMFPLSAIAVAWGFGTFLTPWFRHVTSKWSRHACAVFDACKFLAGLVLALIFANLLASLLTALGFDPRGGIFGTYVQRNALVVGFAMGFAIIPIIYTIAEDALSSVPEHLRSASLGAGATPWQTATRIIIPTAMSGLFSAMMIGLGRAVGETMIVLMAAGNTPVMEWNIFNGFRTLSANIAVELPEAVRNSTHYRTLFLAALTLFVMTFILNTIAEIIRMRFRKKAFEL